MEMQRKNTELWRNYSFYGNTELYHIEIIRKYGENFRFTEIRNYECFIVLTPDGVVIDDPAICVFAANSDARIHALVSNARLRVRAVVVVNALCILFIMKIII